jgi:hypothetical protein
MEVMFRSDDQAGVMPAGAGFFGGARGKTMSLTVHTASKGHDGEQAHRHRGRAHGKFSALCQKKLRARRPSELWGAFERRA